MNLQELLNKKEELDPELELYLQEVDRLGVVIRHPLVYSVPHHEELNAICNAQLKYKKQAIQEAVRHCSWSTYIDLHEKPFRMSAFKSIQRHLDDSAYWDLLSDVFISSENIWQYLDDWKIALKSKRDGVEFFMNDEEHRVFRDLPTVVKVYRGCCRDLNEDGLSYTLDRAVAEKFSRRNKIPYIIERELPRERIFAYLGRRGEREIIMHPNYLKRKKRQRYGDF